MSRHLTKKKKETLYDNNKTILEIIYYIGGGIMYRKQLISLLEEFTGTKEVTTMFSIKELLDAGFLKQKQILNTTSTAVYLTKYPISRIKGIKSRNATAINPTLEKITYSLFRAEYILDLLLNKSFKQKHKDLTLARLLELLEGVANTSLINKNNAVKVYEMLEAKKNLKPYLEAVFFEDKSLAFLEKAELLNRISTEKIKIEKSLKTLKSDRENTKNRFKKDRNIDLLALFFNFSNFLSRGFGMTSCPIKERGITFKLFYFDLNNSVETQKLYKSIGYIYLMLKRYIDTNMLDLKIDITVYTWNKQRQIELIADKDRKVVEFGTGGYSKYRKAEKALRSILMPYDIEKINVSYVSLDLTEKYKFNK